MGSVRIYLLMLTVGCILAMMGRCVPEESERAQTAMPKPTIEEVLAQHADVWLTLPGVVGTAMGAQDDQSCIMIYMAQRNDSTQQKIVSEASGYPVVFEVSGEFKALDSR
ncbi:MAG: hypothetical protein AB1792_08180 [Candidatus Zixiibacteriota bacterium]